MKILVVSDTHGDHTTLRMAIEEEAPFDLLLHLGDTVGYEDYIEELAKEKAGCTVCMVRGNCDYTGDLPSERVLKLGNTKIFMTHGHKYHVKDGLWYLKSEARKKGCTIALYGHTHVPEIDEGDVVAINPGSLSQPRQFDRMASYAVLTVEDDGGVEYEIKYLD